MIQFLLKLAAEEFYGEVRIRFQRGQIAGSDAAMQQHYHGSARVRKGRDIFSSFWQRAPHGKPS